VKGEAQVVAPVHPIPPHCAYSGAPVELDEDEEVVVVEVLEVVETFEVESVVLAFELVLDFEVADVLVLVFDVDDELVPPVEPELKVEPMGPTLISE